MSVWKHKEEIKRLLDTQEGTRVWFKKKGNMQWTKSCAENPKWRSDTMYIVDDKHAELRKEWIDKGTPQLQYNYKNGWKDIEGNNPSWNINISYRIKQNEWKTPGGEDPIEFHANRLCDKGGDWYLVIRDNGEYGQGTFQGGNIPYGIVMMSKDAVEKIIKALNNGDLRLNPQRRG